MASVTDTKKSPSVEIDGAGDKQDLATQVHDLQEECARLRQSLVHAERQREYYRKALYEIARSLREFEDVDLHTLEAESANPVNLIN